MKRLFSELNGFVIYASVVLSNYLRDNNLYNDDILSYLINDEMEENLKELTTVEKQKYATNKDVINGVNQQELYLNYCKI